MHAVDQDEGAYTEQEVRKYFEGRPGWAVETLDTSNLGGADFRICHGERCFLCQVKTIRSVRADIPNGPVVDHFLRERDKNRGRVNRLSRQSPDTKLVMARDEREWLNASDSKYRKKYAGRQRGTEAKVRGQFEIPLRERLGSGAIARLPYDLRLDSDDLYLPSKVERERFVAWLEDQIAAINRGACVDWRWVRQDSPYATPVYSVHYPLHEAADRNDTRHVIAVRLQKRPSPDDNQGLRVDVHTYGALNLERVSSNVEKAVHQLRVVASREERNRRLPRVVALRFQSGLHPLDDFQLLEGEVGSLFKKFGDLSAIAVLQWRPDGYPPPADEGILAWCRFLEQTPRVAFFIVYTNGWFSGVTEELDPRAFSDRWSTHARLGPE
jgi:hypothetical protein